MRPDHGSNQQQPHGSLPAARAFAACKLQLLKGSSRPVQIARLHGCSRYRHGVELSWRDEARGRRARVPRPALPSSRVLSLSSGFLNSHCRRWCVPSLVRRLWCRWFILNKLLLPKACYYERKVYSRGGDTGCNMYWRSTRSRVAGKRPGLPLLCTPGHFAVIRQEQSVSIPSTYAARQSNETRRAGTCRDLEACRAC